MEAIFDLDTMSDVECPARVIRGVVVAEMHHQIRSEQMHPLAELAVAEALINIVDNDEHAHVVVHTPEDASNCVDINATGIKKTVAKEVEPPLMIDDQVIPIHGRGEGLIRKVCGEECYRRTETYTDYGIQESVWLRIQPII